MNFILLASSLVVVIVVVVVIIVTLEKMTFVSTTKRTVALIPYWAVIF